MLRDMLWYFQQDFVYTLGCIEENLKLSDIITLKALMHIVSNFLRVKIILSAIFLNTILVLIFHVGKI